MVTSSCQGVVRKAGTRTRQSHAVAGKIRPRASHVHSDEASDTYTVELLATRQLKYMLSENELQPLEYRAETLGEHFRGRRVQVPCVGAETKDEVMGEVREFDAVSMTYTVGLDSGTVKRGLTSDQIKIPPERYRRPDGTRATVRDLAG